MTVRRISFVAMLVLTLAAGAYAQDFRATLTGVVTDPTGAAIPNATVKATNTATNEVKETKTTADGVYTIPYLNPGTYNIEVTASGFQTLKREAIVLRVADKVNLPVQLTVGAVSQEITVTGQQDVIETGSADRGLVFDPVKTQQYPLNGRQAYMLMALTPGVLFTQEVFGPSGYSGTRGWDVSNAYRINGARTGQNLFLLNGAPISDNNGTWQLAPNVEAVQEFKVMTNTYDAQYGRFGGGVVNTTLRSGSNAWHGDVFDYFRNSVLDANRTENKQVGKGRGRHNQNQFGGVAGGPLRKDRDFIFASFEGWREIIPFAVISDVPNNDLRDGQHFGQYGYTIYDPGSTRICAAPDNCRGSAYIRTAFANGVIPQARISPIGAKILSYFPKANGPDLKALSQNFYATNNYGHYRYDQPMVRWDHVVSEKDKFYTLFTYQHGQEYRDSTGFGPPAGSGDVGSQRTDQNYMAAWTHVLSPTAVLDVRGSFGRFTAIFPRYTDFNLTTDKIGMANMPHAPTWTKNTVPQISLSGFTTLFGLSGAGNIFTWNTYNQWNFAPSLSKTRGKHNLHVGFEYNYVANGNVSPGWSNGTFSFDSTWTRQLSGTGQGTYDGAAIASMLLGVPASGYIDHNDTQYRTRPYLGFYVQDDYKIARKVTLNLGLRYDVQIPWLERFNRENRGWDYTSKSPISDQVLANWARMKAAYDAANPKYPYPAPPAQLTGGFLFPGVGGQPRRLYNTDATNLGPRIGVAWQVLPKTVIRAGGGIYYQSPTQGGTTNGFSMRTNYTSSLDGMTPSSGGSLTGPYSLNNPFPAGFQSPLGSGNGLMTNIGQSSGGYDSPGFKIPRTYQYSFGIQQELPWRVLAEISYAGNYQIYTTLGWEQDNYSLADFNKGHDDAQYLSRQLQNPFYGVPGIPVTATLGASATTAASNLMRPFPQFTSINNNLAQWGHYRYDALQVKMEKRVLGGASTGVMTWALSYAFSKAMQQSSRFESWNLQEPMVKELDSQDKPQNLSFSGVWDLPFGKSRKFVNINNRIADTLVSNWRFDWVLTYVSGYPVGWTSSGYYNSCGEYHAKHQTANSWINNDKSCYAIPVPPNTLRQFPDRFPDIRQITKPQMNIALEKTVKFSERYRFQFRAESFNLSNTPIPGGVDVSVTSSRFGMLPTSQQNWPRLVQLAAKIHF